MKLIYVCLFCMFAFGIHGQEEMTEEAKLNALDETIHTLYNVISGEKGVKRDWDLFRSLFAEGAKLIPVRKTPESGLFAQYMTPEEYISRSIPWFEQNGFFEKEISRELDVFGDIAQLFSTYAAFRTAADEEPFLRGINSIQLLFDGNDWKVVNIYWMAESEQHKIPAEYLD